MQTLGIAQDKAATPPGEVAAAPPLWIPEYERALPGLQLPGGANAAAQPSWEQILVAADLDRESRELSPAERVLADRLAESWIRSVPEDDVARGKDGRELSVVS